VACDSGIRRLKGHHGKGHERRANAMKKYAA
jgi:hypothetical protein